MEYVLTCSCDSQDFTYNDDKFTCIKCGQEYHEEDAGKHLLETSSTKARDLIWGGQYATNRRLTNEKARTNNSK